MSQPEARAARAIVLLRAAVAALLLIHGITRLFLGVGGFGDWLDSQGIPFGGAVAWGVTLGELVLTPLLAAGLATRPIALYLAAELCVGAWMVHLPEGWFVVGAGRNGVEFSVLLITCLLLVAYVGGRPRA